MKWSTEAPTETGWYWFFGDPHMGQMGQDFTDEATVRPRIILAEVRSISNGFVTIGEGQFIPMRQFDKALRGSYGYIDYWSPATLPTEPPDSDGVFTGYKLQ